ncbi:DNA glycosylase [Amylostereum chailletii]|nr:DNA glycosylase [Amylostereum chailletii]
MPVKRSLSPSPKLVPTPSASNPSVTLFKLEDAEHEPVLRRSKRVKTEAKEETDGVPVLVPATKAQKTATKAKAKAIAAPARKATPTQPRKPKSSTPSASDASPKKKKAGPSSPKKPKTIPQILDKPHPAPDGWREVYDAIVEMRAHIVAPVDTQGCHIAQRLEEDPKNKRLITLVSLMLSSQTKDEVCDAAVRKLRDSLGGIFSLDALLAASPATISDAINKVGFWRKKTDYLKDMALRLRDHFDGDVPKTVDELCSIRGVGPKMAFLCLQAAWKINTGIGVDVHVHRITNLLKWHNPPTKNPEQTRLNLQSWLPTELHPAINPLLVGFGQKVCLSIGKPLCNTCTLSARGLCPSAGIASKSRSQKTKASPAKVEIAFDSEGESDLSSLDSAASDLDW